MFEFWNYVKDKTTWFKWYVQGKCTYPNKSTQWLVWHIKQDWDLVQYWFNEESLELCESVE